MEENRYTISKNGIKFYLNVGSLVVYNKKPYYICCESEAQYFCVPFTKGKTPNELVLSDFNFDSSLWVSKDVNFKVVGFLKPYKIIQIMKKYRLWLKEKQLEKTKRRGTLLEKNNDYFYIYGECSNLFNVIKIYDNKDKDMKKINIHDKIYYTLFEEDTILQNDGSYIIKDNALKNEIEDIRRKKKKFKVIEKEEKSIKDKIDVSSIITLKNAPLIKLGVCKLYENYLVAITVEGVLKVYKLKYDEIEICEEYIELDDLTLNIMNAMDEKCDTFEYTKLKKSW